MADLRLHSSLTGAAATAVTVAFLAGACTDGHAEEQVRVQNVALSSTGRFLAAVVKDQKIQPPTGLAAFPDGGIPRPLHRV